AHDHASGRRPVGPAAGRERVRPPRALGPPERALALPRPGRPPGGGDHRLPHLLHGVDEPPGLVRLEPHAAQAHRPRQLPEDPPRRPALPRGGRPHPLLHNARHRRGGGGRGVEGALLQRGVRGPRPPAQARHPPDGRDAGRHRPRFRDDVPPDAGRRELPALRAPAPAVQVDVLERDRALRDRARRRLAVDPAHHADCAGRPSEPASRALRGRPHRWGHGGPGVLAHHPAAAPARHRRRDPVPGDRRDQDLRHHLHHDPGRAGQLDGDDQHPALQPGVLVLQHGLRLVDGGGAVRGGDGRLADPDQAPADRGMVSRGRRRGGLRTVGFYALAALFMLPTVFVFYWMFTLSVKPQVEATASPPSFFSFSLTLKGYQEVFTKYPFLLYTWNSLVVASGCTALGLAVGLPAAYSIARWRQRRFALTVLVARIIPGISYLIPWYIFFRRLHMVDTYGALILTHLIVGLPIIIWVMIGFFEDVPPDLEDAAL